jgi:hypothetical protein
MDNNGLNENLIIHDLNLIEYDFQNLQLVFFFPGSVTVR